MIYDTSSEAWKKFTHAGRCSVCYKKLCETCVVCLKGPAQFDCPCKGDICNQCWTQHVVIRKTTTWTPTGADVCVPCPTCRTNVSVSPQHYDWCHDTVVKKNLNGQYEPEPQPIECSWCDRRICYCQIEDCPARNAKLNCGCHVTVPVCYDCMFDYSRVNMEYVNVDFGGTNIGQFECPHCNEPNVFVEGSDNVCLVDGVSL